MLHLYLTNGHSVKPAESFWSLSVLNNNSQEEQLSKPHATSFFTQSQSLPISNFLLLH